MFYWHRHVTLWLDQREEQPSRGRAHFARRRIILFMSYAPSFEWRSIKESPLESRMGTLVTPATAPT
jgi:hypothetical protein